MIRFFQFSFTQALCLILLSWSCAANALSLGSPQLLSRPGQPLRVEIPIRLVPEDQNLLGSVSVVVPDKASYARLGISARILDLNPQAMVYRNQQERLMVLVETVESVPMTEDPFLDLLINLNWSAGSISKTFTLLLGDPQKITVKSGQTLSEIAAQMTPQLDGASLDQTITALFKANPDAFASGSINRLVTGAELVKPSQALLRSISPAEANHFVADAYAQFNTEQSDKQIGSGPNATKSPLQENTPSDRLKIGSSAEGNAEQRRYTEELVAQEKMLEQSRARVTELEKSIADLQDLLKKSKQQKSSEPNFGLGNFAPAAVAVVLIAFTGLLLWLLARNSRRSELQDFVQPAQAQSKSVAAAPIAMPERAKALFAGIDLNLSATPTANKDSEGSPLADTLRVKLNLARAYITIEDFAAAKQSLAEVLAECDSADPVIAIEARSLLSQLQQRSH